MRGYPPGTKCVVTWSPSWSGVRIGREVVVGPTVFQFDGGQPARSGRFIPEAHGIWMQEIVEPNPETAYPIQWMRPIDRDPDPQTAEVSEEMEA